MKLNIKSKFLNFFRIILLILLCLIIAFLIVWPLWKISTNFSKIYTIIILSLIFIGLVYLIFANIKRNGIKRFLIILLNILLISGGIITAVFLILNQHRLFGLGALVIFIAADIFVNSLLKNHND